MEAVEVTIFIFMAVLIGGLILGFIFGWDFRATFDTIKKALSKEGNDGFEQVDVDRFVVRTYGLWQDCGFGEINKTVRLYVAGTGNLNKAVLFDRLKKLNFCDSIQSANNGCGVREDVIMTDVELPAVVRIDCSADTKKLTITS
jgi:hypothetical protein